jgi:hypothetical protein
MVSKIFECSNCCKTLAELVVTQPDATLEDGTPIRWQMRAACPYRCSDIQEYSFIEEIKGLFHIKGIDRDNSEAVDGKSPVTNLLEVNQQDDLLTIVVGVV